MLKHCISLNVQIKNRSNENILAFLQYILVLFTLVLLLQTVKTTSGNHHGGTQTYFTQFSQLTQSHLK